MTLQNTLNFSFSNKGINQGVIDAIDTADFNQTTNKLAQEIGVVYSDGTTKIISLNEFRAGTRF